MSKKSELLKLIDEKLSEAKSEEGRNRQPKPTHAEINKENGHERTGESFVRDQANVAQTFSLLSDFKSDNLDTLCRKGPTVRLETTSPASSVMRG